MKTSKLHFLLLIFLFTGLKLFAQENLTEPRDSITVNIFKAKTLALITGYQNNNGHFAEIGIGIKENYTIGDKKSNFVYTISNELKLTDDFIWGLKAGVWTGFGVTGLNMGFNFINYTDFNNNLLCFRPEIGIGSKFFRIVYGFNLGLTDSEFKGISNHNLGINIILNLKKPKEERHTRKTVNNL